MPTCDAAFLERLIYSMFIRWRVSLRLSAQENRRDQVQNHRHAISHPHASPCMEYRAAKRISRPWTKPLKQRSGSANDALKQRSGSAQENVREPVSRVLCPRSVSFTRPAPRRQPFI